VKKCGDGSSQYSREEHRDLFFSWLDEGDGEFLGNQEFSVFLIKLLQGLRQLAKQKVAGLQAPRAMNLRRWRSTFRSGVKIDLKSEMVSPTN